MKKSKMLSAACVTGGALFLGSSYMTHKCLTDRTYKTPSFLVETFYKKKKDRKPPRQDERVEWIKEQKFEEFTIESIHDKQLKAYYLPAEKKSKVFVLCSPGYNTPAKKEFRFISKFYHEQNVNLFLVDHQASGESEGRYISFGAKEYPDMLQWVDFLIKKFGSDIKIILHGVSMGAATVLLMTGDASLPKNVKFAISDCSFTHPIKLFENSLKKAHWPVFPLLNGVDMFNRLLSGFSFYTCKNPIEAVEYSNTPTLFIHGKKDNFVPWQMARQLFEKCSAKDKELFYVENASHCASYLKEPEKYEEKIKSFMKNYL